MLKNLIVSDFVSHYQIHPIGISVNEYSTYWTEFDLMDDANAQSPVCTKGKGNVTLQQKYGRIDVLLYDDFCKKIQKPKTLAEGVKHCDFVLTSSHSECVCLIELTSTLGSIAGLSLPIRNKRDEVVFSGGKYEKAEVQLSDSLRMLLAVPCIKADLESRKRKICLMAYRIFAYSSIDEQVKRPFSRYLHIESKMTGDNGAIIACPAIEQYGFEYRRIEHHNAFAL